MNIWVEQRKANIHPIQVQRIAVFTLKILQNKENTKSWSVLPRKLG